MLSEGEGTDDMAQATDTTQSTDATQAADAALEELKALTGGRRYRGRRGLGMGSRSRGRGRGRKGGSFLAEVSVPVALLAATQYMKSRRRYGKTSNRRRRRRGTRKNYRRRSGYRRR
jgi:hypothetical protein